jgi:hypothetical protein
LEKLFRHMEVDHGKVIVEGVGLKTLKKKFRMTFPDGTTARGPSPKRRNDGKPGCSKTARRKVQPESPDGCLGQV